MSDTLHAVVLSLKSPPELLSLVQDYLHTNDPTMCFLLCTDIAPAGPFLFCELVQNDTNKLGRIQIPLGYVVATVDLSKDRPPLGFLSGIR